MTHSFTDPCFLGPQAENAAFFEELLLEFVRDHFYWRRNFHPEDGPAIVPSAQHQAEFLEFADRTKCALIELSAQLKRAVPFFSPRYVGHMSSDLLLPGLLAKMVTTLYNPNNVSEDAAPVTLEKELQVGEQLARMFGFALDPDDSDQPCAWGHLTSGGTVANYEALWNLRSVKFYGIALQRGAAELDIETPAVGPLAKPLGAYSTWELLNLSVDQTIALRAAIVEAFGAGRSRDQLRQLARAVRAARIESMGTAGFFLEHRDVSPPVVLAPSTAHYSWQKSMKVLGLGTRNLVEVATDRHMRLDAGHLDECLERAFAERSPVLAVVGVLGTTEFGTIDPIGEIVRLRREWRGKGCDFGIHVDGAWGGYMAAIFRQPDGSLVPREDLRREFRYFPSQGVYDSFAALPEVDSITVDPHKLGFVPYAAGAFVARNRRIVDFIAQKAAYVFDLGESEQEVPMDAKLRNLGQYILEGSKSGAAAAAVHLTHEVMPLHSGGFGRLLRQTVRASEDFHDRVAIFRERLADLVQIAIPTETDTNLVCLAINPTGNRALAAMNRFGRALFAEMKVDARRPVQVVEFIGSYTSLSAEHVPPVQAQRILEEVGIDPQTFSTGPVDPDRDADHIYLLRHTLMNPWLRRKDPQGRSAIDRYFDFLEGRIRALTKR